MAQRYKKRMYLLCSLRKKIVSLWQKTIFKRPNDIMKKGLLVILCFVAVTIAMAENVSPQQALEHARSFMQSREANGSRPRKAPAKGALQMKMAGQESGLYLFNVSDGEGFVIVSNDDRTAPILGYSDSGSIDPDHMPENMRWWLAEYAKQIAWMDQNGITAPTTTRAAAPRRAHSTTAITPLLTTTWDQVWPYNLLCPEYSAGYYCATGCVATAMAQVMKHFGHPAKPTKDIVSYTHSYFGTMGPLTSSVNFDWANMLNSYETDESKSTDTDAEKTAVATLMKYCGYALKMGYWQSSGTSTSLVATALKEYFDYHKTTTRYLSRSFYSYETWRDIIYYELSQNRPVVYGGAAADNGHAFVCDGYKYESGTDLFHINWGWSGGSDGYFLLSVLNPSEQGTGGSPTASAYTFGQEAIIGIQPSTMSGDVLPAAKTPATMKLTVNSIAVSHPTIALGESVDVTLNVTNNGSDYDGDLYVIDNSGAQLIGKTVQIPSGAKQDCVITYTPTEAKAYTLSYGFPLEGGGYGYPYPITMTVGLTVEAATPTALATTALTSQSATLNWTQAGTATKWNLRYRPVSVEKFNGSTLPTGWNIYDRDDDGHNWEPSAGTGLGGSNCVASPGYLSGNLNPIDWLETSEFDLGGSISFSAWGEDECFVVWISTDGVNFKTISYVITTTDTPTRYSFDLGEYAGKKGYIVIDHRKGSDKSAESWLYVDDLVIVEPGTSWTTMSDIAARPYTLGGLTANSDYEVQLQAAFNDGGNWSEGIAFTTPYGLADNDLALATKNTDVVSKLNGQAVDICLDGRTLYKDGCWNTLCLPFDVTIAGSPLAGGEAKVFDAAASGFSAGSRQLTLAFTDAPATIAAGTPFVIKWTSGANLVSPVFSGVTISNAANNGTSTDGKVTFTGLVSALNISADDLAKLFLGNGNKLYAPMSGIKFGACRAYFQLNGITMNPSVGGGVKAFVLDFGDGGATSIQHIDGLQQDGQSPDWYTLDGRRMDGQPQQRGVYIKNGRKVVIK